MTSSKLCNGCNEVKDVCAFNKCTRDGYQSKCKECRKKHRTISKEKISAYGKMYREINKDKVADGKKQYAGNNKVKLAKYLKEYKKMNAGSICAINSKRRSTKKQACPPWLTKAQHEEIIAIYKQAKELEAIFFNRKFHVDHIVPLQGKDVCGLHVPWNLQILTAEENLKKGARNANT